MILQISTLLSECENKEKSKKIQLENIGNINILAPFVTTQISTADLTNQHARNIPT